MHPSSSRFRGLCAGLWALAFTGCGGEAEPYDMTSCGPSEATVTRVLDGDTVELDSGEKVRYLLVDAPETSGAVPECYGPEAKAQNAQLVEGKVVMLRYERTCEDKYGRLLAYVRVDGQDINRTLVERGYACVLYIPPAGEARKAEFEALESAAKTGSRGLWGFCPVHPC